MKIALVGNQNCGKSTLFNDLTGASAHVGNFPGVTVDSKVGQIKNQKHTYEVIDLPGIYSLSPYSNEEIVTRDFILNQDVDLILNIIDATNIERNLYLTLQLIELNKPIVIALNMMDQVAHNGNSIDINILSEKLGIDIIPISASSGAGVDELIKKIKYVGKNQILPKVNDFCEADTPMHRAIHGVMTLLSDHAQKIKLPIRYAASRILEGDQIIEKKLLLTDNEKDLIGHIVIEMEKDSGLDKEAAFASMRYNFIDNICSKAVIRKNPYSKEQILSNKIDSVLTNKYLAFPFFLIILGLVFYLTFGVIGYHLSNLLSSGIDLLIEQIRTVLINNDFNAVAISLLCDGVLNGVGSVIGFLPTILTLFLFLSILEDSGYMSRIAFIMDRPFRKFGLSGRSVVPLLIGFGCSVPAVMASRTMTSERDKKITILLIPFMSCSAKIPVYTLICAAFFGRFAYAYMILLYFIGVVLAIIVTLISGFFKKGKSTPFMMEIPPYRLPTFKNTIALMWEKAADFLKKAFTIIFIASCIIWFLQSFDYHLNFVTDNQDSMLAGLAKLITPIFNPIGVHHWEVTSAILTGLTAKESIVSTLQMLLQGAPLTSLMNSFQAFSLLIFIALYMPCVATFATIKKELKSLPKAIGYMTFQTLVAYLVALLVYQIGGLF